MVESIPSFLKLTAEERRQAWEKNPPRAVPAILDHKPVYRTPADEAEIAAFKVERERREKIAAEARAESRRVLARQKRIPGSTWDMRRGVWVHPVIEAKKAEDTGESFRLIVINRSPRAAGTGAAARFAEMLAFLEGKPRARMAEIYASTSYTRADFDWDLQRGSVQKDYTKE
jgi:hypothetical protein